MVLERETEIGRRWKHMVNAKQIPYMEMKKGKVFECRSKIVIEIVIVSGDGTEEDPFHYYREYHTMEGECIGRIDDEQRGEAMK